MLKSFIIILSCLFAFEASAQETESTQTTESQNSNPGTDATNVDIESLNHPYNLPDGYSAVTADRAFIADIADRALIADFADLADFATTAGEAETADEALNTALLNGRSYDYFLNASNLSTGQISLDRLVGTIVDDGGRVLDARLSGTYNIDITGNASSATRADEARRAQSAIVCTGGANGCDF